MSDGKEERKEQGERRKWEEERKNPGRAGDLREPDWERDGRPERRDSRAAGAAAASSIGGSIEARRPTDSKARLQAQTATVP